MKSFGKKPEDRQAENQLAQAALSQPPAAADKLKAALQFAADKNPLKSLILADFYLFDIRRYYKDGFEGFARRANETGSIYTSYIEDLQKRLNETWKLFRQSLIQLAAPFM